MLVTVDNCDVPRLDCCGLAAAASWGGKLDQLQPSAPFVERGWNAEIYTAPEISQETTRMKAKLEAQEDKKKTKMKKYGNVYPNPEDLVLGRAVSPAADVFAFGVLVWEIFSGQVRCSSAHSVSA